MLTLAGCSYVDVRRLALGQRHQNAQPADLRDAKDLAAAGNIRGAGLVWPGWSLASNRSAEMSAPTSTFLAVTIPANGDVTFSYPCSVISLSNVALAARTNSFAATTFFSPAVTFASAVLAAVICDIAGLARYCAGFRQHLVPLPGDVRKIPGRDQLFQGRLCLAELAFGLRQRGLCLRHLLVQIGSVDFRQQLSRGNPVPDIDVSPLQVPGGAREDVCFGDRCDAAGKRHLGQYSALA